MNLILNEDCQQKTESILPYVMENPTLMVFDLIFELPIYMNRPISFIMSF